MAFFNNTSFNEILKKAASVGEDGVVKRIDEKSLFIINDIELVIPPTNIQIHKEDIYYNHKTLRTSMSTKVPTGQGFCQVALNCVFTPDLILHLHRLIVQLKSSPFVWVENMFIRQSIVPEWDLTRFMGFVVSSFHVNTVPGLPGTFSVRMDLKWFNYQPYTPNFLFRKDFLTLPMKDGGDGYCQKTIPVITGKNLQRDHVPLKVTSKVLQKYFSGIPVLENQSFESLLATSENNQSLENTINKFSGILMDGQQLPDYIMPSLPCIPAESHIYKRHINDLQFEALMFNFGIDVYEMFEDMELLSEFETFTTGKAVASKANSYRYRYVQSFHLMDGSHADSIRSIIINKMHSWHPQFLIRYNQFNSVAWPSFVERAKKKIAQEYLLPRMNLNFDYSGVRKDVLSTSVAAKMYTTGIKNKDTTATVELRRSKGRKKFLIPVKIKIFLLGKAGKTVEINCSHLLLL